MGLRDHLIHALRRRLGEDGLPLRIAFRDGAAFDLGGDARVTLTLASARAQRRLLRGDLDGLAACYVEGDLIVEGGLGDVIRIGSAFAGRLAAAAPPAAALARRIAPLLGRFPGKHTRRRDARAIRHHYDFSNEFYRLWLDRRMVYSCGYFPTGSESLDAAQEAKLDHICRKLRLGPRERLLDIGCGWGGLLLWAARHYGVSGLGITLSERQCALARQRIATEGLQGQIEIRRQDYRDLAGRCVFDKIASIGMVEHVGLGHLPRYFRTIERLLKPGGLVLNDGITTGGHESGGGPAGGGFLDRYVFPDGELAHISRILFEMAAARLEPFDVESLRPHYAETLLRWVARLEAHREEAMVLAGERRYRIWRIFMAGAAHAFDQGWLDIHQVLAAKRAADGPAAPPRSRAYQDERGAAVALAGRLDWRILDPPEPAATPTRREAAPVP